MLVLSRKVGERIRIGDNCFLEVLRVTGNKIRLGIDAPKDVKVVRGELEVDVEPNPPLMNGDFAAA